VNKLFLIDLGAEEVTIETGCCRNPFSLSLKHFLINLGLAPGDVKTRPKGRATSQ